MNQELPDGLREYIRSKDKKLADRADRFWEISKPIIERQNRVDSNENGYLHVETVERNGWRLIKDSGKVSEFNVCELFILSCGACCHDFDKGLFDSLPKGVCHGEASGEFLTQENKIFLQNFHESVAIEKIIGIHDFKTPPFQEELEKIHRTFSLSTGSIKLQMLAVILKAADILHTDSSRIPPIGINSSRLDNDQKKKNLAREAISGWDIDGTRIVIQATPQTSEHLSALEGCIAYIKETEWPTVRGKLSDYGFPFDLEFKIDRSKCGEPKSSDKDSDKTEQPGGTYSQGNFVFNVPYKEKGNKVVGRETALQKLRKQLTDTLGTAIGQTASFLGMGGLGKTQLAVEYAYRYRGSYPNGVIWINADQDIDSQLIQISKKGDWIAPESEHKIILDTAHRRLTTYSDCLIVFDNVEKYEVIEPYLPETQATPHLILTSHEPVPGFEPIDIDILNDDDSLDLLMMESGRDYDSLSFEEKDAAKRTVKELGGLPLAIEIAGAYLKYSQSISIENYLAILKDSPSSALAGKMFKGYTAHESDLYRTLKVSESIFEHAPLLKEILDVLTWSGSSFMGLSLLSAILDVPESKLYMPLSSGTTLRILRKGEAQNRYEIHRLLRTVRQEEFSLMNNLEWAEAVCTRIGTWFETRREDFTNLSCYESEIDHLKQWEENAEKINSNQNARLLWLQAYPSYHWGKYKNSCHILESALELYEKKTNDDIALKAHIISDIGIVTSFLGNYKKALEFQGCALEIREKQLGPEHPDTVNSLNNIGGTYGALGEHRKALEFKERALKIAEKQFGPEHPDTATSLNNIGGTYGALGEHRKALEFQERALKINEKQLGPEHPNTANSLNNIGGTYGELGEHRKALEFKERALKIREKQLGPEHPDTANSLNNVISSCLKINRFNVAYTILDHYLAVLPKTHLEYNYFESLKVYIDKKSVKSGFRPPSAIQTNKKKKKGKSKKKR
jgi:tetratricopeptide (TPR) repeat protein